MIPMKADMPTALAHLEEHREEVEKIVEALVLSLVMNGRAMQLAGIEHLCAAFVLDVASVALGEIALDHYTEEAKVIVLALAKKAKADIEARADAALASRPTQPPAKA